ncbi:unnamed protein product [Rotaria sordida]|uniref:Phytanoyl-CoA dioxygenase n=2 Tax=Rotaria sordida TaxID=392033 RepID=A0A819N7T1_9BILA|nr:unnamed protein product [Rotaria sordida]
MSSETPVYVQLGPRKWELGGEYLKQLEPCNYCLNAEDVGSALRNQLDDKGYIYLKQVLPEEDVSKAKHAVLEYLQHLIDTGVIKKPIFSSSYIDGILSDDYDIGSIPSLEGSNPITNHPAVLRVVENPYLYDIFTTIFHGIHPITFDFKWLRTMHHGANTGCHLDRVYMNRGSSDLLTCWIPFDNLTIDMSVLAVLEGIHRMDRPENDGYTKLQHTYADMDVERDKLQGTGWFTEDPMEFYQLNDTHQSSDSNPIWKTTAFSAGDIIIFTTRTIHMSSVNLTNKLRISCDTRWQPSDQPADPRFARLAKNNIVGHGDAKFGLYAKDLKKVEDGKTTMEQWRKTWGFPTKAEK